MLGIYESISALAKKVNRLCCAVQQLQDGGGSYLKYVALLNQSGGAAPVATILENTLGGTPIWTKSSTGIFNCTLNGAFPENKTFCLVTYGLYEGNNGYPSFGRSGDDYVTLYLTSYNGTGAAVDFNNSPANDICVEIRVYP